MLMSFHHLQRKADSYGNASPRTRASHISQRAAQQCRKLAHETLPSKRDEPSGLAGARVMSCEIAYEEFVCLCVCEREGYGWGGRVE